jgi:glutamyl-tRNA reductase
LIFGALRQKLQAIARAEYQRQRPKLGALTPEQEGAIEALLLAVVNKIAHPVISRMRRSHETGVAENMQAWRDIFELEEKE